MAAKKNGHSIAKKTKPTKPIHSQAEVDELIRAATHRGRLEGTKESCVQIITFLRERMVTHFDNRQDELAKELRSIVIALQSRLNKI